MRKEIQDKIVAGLEKAFKDSLQDDSKKELDQLQKMTAEECLLAFQSRQFSHVNKAQIISQLHNIVSNASKEAIAFGKHKYISEFAEQQYKDRLKQREDAQAIIELLEKLPDLEVENSGT